MTILQQSWAAGGNASSQTGGASWRGQTFTPSAGYTIEKVKLFIYFYTGFPPGNITVGIWNTVADLPSGGDLCSGTTNGSTLPNQAATGFWAGAEWREIDFGAGTLLAPGTKYAIVWRSVAVALLNCRASAGGFAGGNLVRSDNAGVDWIDEPGLGDQYFENWGTGLPAKAFVSPASKLVAARLI